MPAGTLTFEAMDVNRRFAGGSCSVVMGACVVVSVVVLIAMMSDRYEPPAARVVSPHAESLELLSLDASRDGSTLAVTGLVRSRAEEPLDRGHRRRLSRRCQGAARSASGSAPLAAIIASDVSRDSW